MPTTTDRVYAEPTDQEFKALLSDARDGDPRALGEVYDRYSPRIYRYLYRRTGDPDLAEDLTGSVFLKVVDAVHKGSPWRSSFTGWLYRIAHNILSDYRRALTRRPECQLQETLPSEPDSEMDERAETGFALDVVSVALGELRPEYANVIRLRFNEGLPHALVAAQLGKTEGAVKVAQHRALKILRSRLAPQMGLGNLAG